MRKWILLTATCLSLTACETFDIFGGTEAEKRLEGERLSLHDFEKSLQQDGIAQFGMPGEEGLDNTVIALSDALKAGGDDDISLISPWDNQFWPQQGGYPNHAMKHVAFTSGVPEKIWSKDIGAGGSDRMPLTASPIMADDTVYVMNNDAEVIAYDYETGESLWTTEVMKSDEDEHVLGGGISFSGGRIFVTNGFNELLALNAKTGDILWRTSTKEPVRAAPSAIPDRVFVVTMANRTLAFDAQNGEELWRHRGLSGGTGVLGAAKPAIARDAVITAYETGEVYALQIDTGVELWSENLTPLARAVGQAVISDIKASPIIDKNNVYALSYNNRMNAIDSRSGRKLWDIPLGAGTTPWLSGNRIFVIESQGTLTSVDRENGTAMWQTPLPQFQDEKDREDPISWQGPYLAGKNLLAFGSHGKIYVINPVNGKITDQYDYDDGVLLPPVIAKQTLFTLDDDGDLSAWR